MKKEVQDYLLKIAIATGVSLFLIVFFSQSGELTFSDLLLAAITLIGSFIIQDITIFRERKRISWASTRHEVLKETGKLVNPDKLSVIFDNRSLKIISTIRLVLINDGYEDVRIEDFSKLSRIKINMTGTREIIEEPIIVHKSTPANNPTVEKTEESGSYYINFDYLGIGDNITIQFSVADEIPNSRVSVEGKIIGAARLSHRRNLSELEYERAWKLTERLETAFRKTAILTFYTLLPTLISLSTILFFVFRNELSTPPVVDSPLQIAVITAIVAPPIATIVGVASLISRYVWLVLNKARMLDIKKRFGHLYFDGT